jgi:alkanesulfonate monooxygenase SsuD/methylene tetrahydromethanopterin reductase-like flavin-dependent oxidoreductase (luciferase family)
VLSSLGSVNNCLRCGQLLRAARFGEVWIPTDYTLAEYRDGIPKLKEASKHVDKPTEIGVASHLMTILANEKDEAESTAKNIAEELHQSVDNLKDWALVGNVKSVMKRIEAYNERGVSYHVLNFGTKVKDESKIELFAREILPSFK